MRVVTVRRVLQGSTDGVLTLGRLGEISNLHLALTISHTGPYAPKFESVLSADRILLSDSISGASVLTDGNRGGAPEDVPNDQGHRHRGGYYHTHDACDPRTTDRQTEGNRGMREQTNQTTKDTDTERGTTTLTMPATKDDRPTDRRNRGGAPADEPDDQGH